jgi:hypothetical protein
MIIQPTNYYQKRITQLQLILLQLQQKNKLLGWGRLCSSVGAIPVVYWLWPLGWLYIVPVALLFLIVFTKLILLDFDNNTAINQHKNLIIINEDELKALNGDYLHFSEGNQYVQHDHLYANDVDIFGRASLYQYINRTTSYIGGGTLAAWLLQPADTETILERQDAVKELSAKTPFRQDLQALGIEKKIAASTKDRLQNWLHQPSVFLTFKPWAFLKYLLPAIILTITALNLLDIVPNSIRNLFIFVFGIIAYFTSKRATPVQQQLSKIVDEISVLKGSIALIENASFTSPYLLQLQQYFRLQNGKASKELQTLKQLLDRMDLRYNPVVFIPLDIFLLWDVQQVLALEKWKKHNQQNILNWIEALGKMEAISSLATVHFNQPDWCMPVLKERHFSIEATALGHPLIQPLKRVNNFININHKGELMLVTGSNMAGKSTYLRSVGVNVVLAMAGSVVCAKSFAISPVQLITSMRIADNLEENTSTFYAELKKLKTVIESVNKEEKIFLLLDEILRGTNSLDRHTGSAALIKQLIKKDACGIIATHDVELAKLKELYPTNILNYYFDVQVSNDELYFDYLLKEGICSSLNASILMRKIGIEI